MIKLYTALAILTVIFTGCASVENNSPTSVYKLNYTNDNYVVTEGQIWKLTWDHPYEKGELHPAYDVRVLGAVYTTKDRDTQLNVADQASVAISIFAGEHSAEIWIGENTEFYLANERIQVTVEAYNSE